MRTILPIDRRTLEEFCRRHHIRRLSLFGSYLNGSNRSDSDIDLLVEFEPGQKPGLLGFSAMRIELSSLFGGKEVDLRTPEDLSHHFRKDVMENAEVQIDR